MTHPNCTLTASTLLSIAGAFALAVVTPGAPAIAAETIRRDVVHIGGRPCLRTELRSDTNAAGIGNSIEAEGAIAVAALVDTANHLWYQPFDPWLRRAGALLDGGALPPPGETYAAITRWSGPYVWLAIYKDTELSLYLRRIDPSRNLPLIEFEAVPNIWQDGSFSVAAGNGAVFAVLDGGETDGNEFGVFGRVLDYNGNPVTPRLRIGVGSITPSLAGPPVVTSQGAAVAIRLNGTTTYLRTLTGPTWSMSPWLFVANGPSVQRALIDGRLIIWFYDQSANRSSVQRAAFNGTLIGQPLDIDARAGEGFRADGQGNVVVARVRGGLASFHVYSSTGSLLIAPTALPLGDPLPVRRIVDLAYTDDGTIWIAWRANDAAFETFEYYLTAITPIVPGDLNGDGVFNGFDVDPFVLALTNREAYQAAFPHMPPEAIDILGDLNGDGVLTNFDIDPFVDALVNGP